MSEWRRTALSHLGEIYDGPHATPARQSAGPYFLNIASLSRGRLDVSLSDHVTAADFIRWTRRVTPRAGDLLFSYETRLGEAALMPAGMEACLGRRMALLRPNVEQVDPRFLLYAYLGPEFQATVEMNTIHGATVNRIPLNRMGTWTISLPNLAEQQAIAEVLGALDDKIAANMALSASSWNVLRTMFRSAQASADSIGQRLGDVASLEYGKALPTSSRTPGSVAVVGSGGVSGSHASAIVEASGVVVGRKGTAGSVHWISGPHFPIDTTFYVRGRREVYSQPYLYFLLAGLGLADMNNDSAVPGLNRAEALTVPVSVPNDSHLRSFSRAAAPTIDLVEAVERENRTLAATRDALLPQLMSGKLRVKDLPRTPEEAQA